MQQIHVYKAVYTVEWQARKERYHIRKTPQIQTT